MKCCDLTAGMLRKKVEIQRVTNTRDNLGGSVKSWAKVQDAWFHLKPLSGGERLQAMRIEATITHRAHCRASVDIAPADRVVYDGRTFNVRAVLDIEERGKWYEVELEEGVAT